mmetsp:Transcript_66933/g.151228  ORF Transcript_66933/g.151228 Transcript_66933/m.151228 type:complete len:246 (-) Transcript_66933:74-811(-)
MWEPRPRWIPLHSMHRKTPRLIDTQLGTPAPLLRLLALLGDDAADAADAPTPPPHVAPQSAQQSFPAPRASSSIHGAFRGDPGVSGSRGGGGGGGADGAEETSSLGGGGGGILSPVPPPSLSLRRLGMPPPARTTPAAATAAAGGAWWGFSPPTAAGWFAGALRGTARPRARPRSMHWRRARVHSESSSEEAHWSITDDRVALNTSKQNGTASLCSLAVGSTSRTVLSTRSHTRVGSSCTASGPR